MSDWLRRLAHSRRARNFTIAGLAILLMGSTGGQLLANYTVTGMDPLYFSAQPPQIASSEQDDGLIREISFEDWGPEIPQSGSPESRTAEYSQASY